MRIFLMLYAVLTIASCKSTNSQLANTGDLVEKVDSAKSPVILLKVRKATCSGTILANDEERGFVIASAAHCFIDIITAEGKRPMEKWDMTDNQSNGSQSNGFEPWEGPPIGAKAEVVPPKVIKASIMIPAIKGGLPAERVVTARMLKIHPDFTLAKRFPAERDLAYVIFDAKIPDLPQAGLPVVPAANAAGEMSKRAMGEIVEISGFGITMVGAGDAGTHHQGSAIIGDLRVGRFATFAAFPFMPPGTPNQTAALGGDSGGGCLSDVKGSILFGVISAGQEIPNPAPGGIGRYLSWIIDLTDPKNHAFITRGPQALFAPPGEKPKQEG